MRAIFVTQSASLRPFYQLMQELRDKTDMESVGFFVAHSLSFHEFTHECPEILLPKYTLLKEWEIYRHAKEKTYSPELVREYEQQLGNPNLWGPLVGDRRVYLGKMGCYRQSYHSRYTHSEMVNIMGAFLVQIEKFIDRMNPSVIFSFVCVTMADYLFYLFARNRNIMFLNLRTIKIEDSMIWNTSIFDSSEHIHTLMVHFKKSGISEADKKWCQEFLKSFRAGQNVYEGATLPSRKTKKSQRPRATSLEKVKKIRKLITKEIKYWCSEARTDPHISNAIVSMFYTSVLNSIRAKYINRKISGKYITEENLSKISYAFYPLHTEPETSLLVRSRAYLNQIEVVRMISHSLPLHMKLLIKEHPVAIGRRPYGYYQKLLRIPNVLLVDPALSAQKVIQYSAIVTVINSSVGFEALLMRKPVISLAESPWRLLPECMNQLVLEPHKLAHSIHAMLHDYQYDEEALMQYLVAVKHGSVRMPFYSLFLRKQGVVSSLNNKISEKDYMMKWADYTLERIAQEMKRNINEEDFMCHTG